MTLTATETAHGEGWAINGFDSLICARHLGALDFDGSTPSGFRAVCRIEGCTTRAIVR